MKNTKQFSLWLGIIVVAVLAVGGMTKAYSGSAHIVVEGDYIEAMGSLGGAIHNIIESFDEGIAVDGTTVIDGDGNWDGAITGTTGTFSSTFAVTGGTTLSSGIILDTGAIVATSTLTSTSDNNQLLGASAVFTTVTLPAATDGLSYKFVVTGALTGEETLIDSAEGDNISGLLQVNGADVACSAEDQINIITDGEVIGDFVELLSDGTNWYIVGSQADAADKMTCTDPS